MQQRLSSTTSSARHRVGRTVGSAASLGALALAAVTGPGAVSATAGHDLRPVASAAGYSAPFRAATFNVLGANHTRNSTQFATYDLRMRRAVGLIARRKFDLIGFQELQNVQYEQFARTEGSTWAAYPGAELGNRIGQNSIGWRTDTWQLVEKHTYQIPYFHGTMVAEPYIKLRNRDTGLSVWVMNTHNPADAHGPAQQWRDQAIDIEARLANQLRATNVPLVFTGDFNDRDDAFCRLMSQTTLQAANGGSWSAGSCQPPRDMRIDWIFMSRALQPSNYTVLDNDTVHYITDHKIIYSDISLPLG
jgi:endonuclease/exonuclease/phosphatase family metal-dependent hydrolase